MHSLLCLQYPEGFLLEHSEEMKGMLASEPVCLSCLLLCLRFGFLPFVFRSLFRLFQFRNGLDIGLSQDINKGDKERRE